MAQNMFRVGDYIFIESSVDGPYAVRRIEELIKTSGGNVEARVTCFYRRREIEKALLKIADQAERKFEEFYEVDKTEMKGFHPGTGHTVANGDNELKKETESENSEQNEETEKMETEEKETTEKNGENGQHETTDTSTTGVTAPLEVQKEDDLSREWGSAGLPLGAEKLEGKERHLLRHRELFLSRHQETVNCQSIRGRCLVTLLNEVEDLSCYEKEDHFFYSLVYDPAQLTLLADKGAIRVSDKYQAKVPDGVDESEVKRERDSDENKENGDDLMIDEEAEDSESSEVAVIPERETLVYHPHHSLSDRDIDQFLIIARAVGTFSRALDTSSSMKLPSLHMTAAAASRDITLFHAMALLHQAGYEIGQATRYLCPPPSKEHYPLDADKASGNHTVSLGGPILCRDQLEEWSAAESNLFEEAMEKYGKDFHDIRNDYLPWKSIRDIVEYYYMWKTTNRYVDAKKAKQAENENKLKQVYIPSYNKPSPNLIGVVNTSGSPIKSAIPCESCTSTESTQWYSWGPQALQLRICHECFTVWKKLGVVSKPHSHDSYDLKEPEREVQLKAAVASADKTPATRAPMSKNVAGQIVARLPPNHPAVVAAQAAAAAGAGVHGQAAAAQAVQAALIRGINPETVLNLASSASGQSLGPSTSTDVKGSGKTRLAFSLNTTLLTKVARRLAPKKLLNLRKSARRPFDSINAAAVKQHCLSQNLNQLVTLAQAISRTKLSQQFLQSLLAQQTLATQQQQSPAIKRPASQQDNMGPAAKKAAP